MHAVRSLGLHKPAALSYLIGEGLLPESCSRDAYSWDTFEDHGKVDELVYTQTHVVWSGGSNVYRVFSFDAEKEPVKQALFAYFPTQDLSAQSFVKKPGTPQLKLPKRSDKSSREPEKLRNVKTSSSLGSSGTERALVVVLQSHAQVFFLSGARSMIPFQFEVERAYPLEEGLIFQRRSPDMPIAWVTASLPQGTPPNSFAPQTLMTPTQPGHASKAHSREPAYVRELFDSVLSSHDAQTRASVPYHYYLSDPFSDFGVLGSGSNVSEQHTEEDELFHRRERLIYVSSKDEALSKVSQLKCDPLQLAVSIHPTKCTLSVWQVTKPATGTFWRPQRRATAYDIDKKKRRRSSQPGTGAVTPNPRQSMAPRESFGGPQESFTARGNVRDDGDLAAQLDPAFQDPRVPGHATRRISSMLARSDLAGMDMFNDGAGGAPPPPGRRGASLGGVGKSFRAPAGQKREAQQSIRSEPDGMDADMKEDDGKRENETEKLLAELATSSNGLRVGLRMVRVHVSSFDSSMTGNLRVFSISSSREGDSFEEITVCIHSRSARELYLIEAQAIRGEGTWQVKVSQQRRAPDVVDVCLLRNEAGDKLAILSQTEAGSFQVALQAPHTATFKITIPTQLLINFPYSLRPGLSSHSKRVTGPRRLLDDVPHPLQAIETGAGPGQLIVTDKSGAHHLFRITLQPESAFIHRCITLCEIVWRPQRAPRQRFLQAWWEVMRFLGHDENMQTDSEWKALVVLLFSLCSPSNLAQKPTTPLRQKRKSGGLLRSSSGAAIDLEKYYSAVSHESRNSAQPHWSRSCAWQWVGEESLEAPIDPSSGLGLVASTNASVAEPLFRRSSFLLECTELGHGFLGTEAGKQVIANMRIEVNGDRQSAEVAKLREMVLVALHFLREDAKLDQLMAGDVQRLCPVLAQLGGWHGWIAWSWHAESTYMSENVDMRTWSFEKSSDNRAARQPTTPPSIMRSIIEALDDTQSNSMPMVAKFSNLIDIDNSAEQEMSAVLPRLAKVHELLTAVEKRQGGILASLQELSIDHNFLESLPEGIAAPLRSAISSQQSAPDPSSAAMADLLDRPDLALLEDTNAQVQGSARPTVMLQSHSSNRDPRAICKGVTDVDMSVTSKTDASAELDRMAVTRLIFKDDHRVAEAQKLLHPLEPPTIKCAREPEWSEHDLLEAEQELAKVVAVRTLSVSAGRGLMQFGARIPLLTERFPTHGFTLSCVMKPSNNNVTAEKDTFTEEKVSWAFFHAGAEAGLSISKKSKGIDTSWIVFNKPPELNNRHAGFLLALGLNGHLKNIAKWVAFKYLTPKHTMTSVGLLLGLAASYLGTMDTLITRLLSVHVTRMLPPGAAELNLSPITQTTGIMALGLLYCNTQHRRMSEVMLSEMENEDQDENESPLDTLRDEGYRLAAGFALGFINLGQGKNLKGLHDMHIVERLLGLAVSTKQVELMHILDKGTAAATIAIALIFMKTEDEALANKINIPDTPHQFEYIRPDLFLLRTVARHLILWRKIEPTVSWMKKQLPSVFVERYSLRDILALDIKDLPLFNSIAGLCLVIGLRFAGSADVDVCKLLIAYLDQFMRLTRLAALTYDHRLTRTTVRNCQDVVALAAATVMAGTGNVDVFRRLRSLHGRTDPDTTYGSHMAAHQAIGVLFLAGGTHTFTTSNLAVASLMCAFYPLFPAAVLDNKGHLQAFRHLWVLATEQRCLVVRDIDSHRPVSMPITIRLKTGAAVEAQAPCLLPELSTVASVSLNDPKCWNVALDFGKENHRQAFEQHQSMFAARKRVEDSRESTFITAMQAQAASHDEEGKGHDDRVGFAWIFDLPSFHRLNISDRATALPNALLGKHVDMATTAVDDQLVLKSSLTGKNATELWSLRALLAWADKRSRSSDEKIGWLEREVIGALKAELGLRLAQAEENVS